MMKNEEKQWLIMKQCNNEMTMIMTMKKTIMKIMKY